MKILVYLLNHLSVSNVGILLIKEFGVPIFSLLSHYPKFPFQGPSIALGQVIPIFPLLSHYPKFPFQVPSIALGQVIESVKKGSETHIIYSG